MVYSTTRKTYYFKGATQKKIFVHEVSFKKALARETGAQGVFFDEKKTPKVENLVTLSLFKRCKRSLAMPIIKILL
jgi:hypothetical protein